jgi:hypothetical protein
MAIFKAIYAFFLYLYKKFISLSALKKPVPEDDLKSKAIKEFMDKTGDFGQADKKAGKKGHTPWYFKYYGTNSQGRKALPMFYQPVGFGNCRPLRPFAGTRKAKLFDLRKSTRDIL